MIWQSDDFRDFKKRTLNESKRNNDKTSNNQTEFHN